MQMRTTQLSDHYLLKVSILFPFNSNRPEIEEITATQKLEIPHYNLISFFNNSTKYLYQQRLNEKLTNIIGKPIVENNIQSLHGVEKEH